MTADSRHSEISVPKAFLFDIGNVLARFDFAPAVRAMAAHSAHPPARPMAALLEKKDAFEAGRIAEECFVAGVIADWGYRGTADEFVAEWSAIFEEIPAMTRSVEALAAAGHPLFLLSNTNAPHLRHLRATYPVFRHFRGGIFSHEIGAMKPADVVFRAVIDRFALVPAETLYIDDLAANIAAGRRHGFRTHHYDAARHADFDALLVGFGVASPDCAPPRSAL